MPDTTYNVQAVFSVADRISGPLKGIASTVTTLDQKFQSITSGFAGLVSLSGLVGAGFGLREAVNTTKDWLETIQKVQRETGLAAENASQLYGAFALSDTGVQGLSLYTKQWMMHMKGATELGETAMMQMEGMGRKDPWKQLKNKDAFGALLEISDAIAKAPDKALKSAQYFGRYGGQSLLPMMEEGAKAIRARMEATKSIGLIANAETMNMWERYQDSSRTLSLQWKTIQTTIGTEILPLLTQFANDLGPTIQTWTGKVADTMKMMREHMHQMVFAAKALVGYLAISKGLQMVTGQGGIGGGVKAWEMAKGGIGSVGSWAGFGAKTAAGTGMATTAALQALPTTTTWGGMFLGPLKAFAAGPWAKLGAVTGFLAMGAGMVVAAFENVNGVLTFMKESAIGLIGAFGGLVGVLFGGKGGKGGLLSDFASGIGWVFEKIGEGLDWLVGMYLKAQDGIITAISYILAAVRGLIHVVQNIPLIITAGVDTIPSLFTTGFQAALGNMIEGRAAWEKAARDFLSKKPATEEKLGLKGLAQQNFSFPGATFNIKQDFKEAEPDRIITQICNEVAALSENKISTSVVPAFTG